MMKKSCLLFTFVIISIVHLHAQQWMDKNYTYDSILNIKYGRAINFVGGMDTLEMDVYLPHCSHTGSTANRPLLMWIHGGAFLAGDKNDPSIQDLCKQFAKRGYVTASISYRLGFVSDKVLHQCNYPNYPCVFAVDSAEWVRSYYRAVQDAKGALRYLINRHELYKIDLSNIFVAGESAGAFTALGVALLDTSVERPSQTFAINNVPLPHIENQKCPYNVDKKFNTASILRPDLGGIEGSIEPTNINYTIKGVGNMYGAMLTDLLKFHSVNKILPAIYSFHQPCDIVVPIDSGFVYWGLSWCLTNGYNCLGISNNNIMLYGSRVIHNLNIQNNYGYSIQSEYGSIVFPYNFLFGQGSCLDQVNNPCHAYDNKLLRENNLAKFFASKITTDPICEAQTNGIQSFQNVDHFSFFPNPSDGILTIQSIEESDKILEIKVFDTQSNLKFHQKEINTKEVSVQIEGLASGIYFIQIMNDKNFPYVFKFLKQ